MSGSTSSVDYSGAQRGGAPVLVLPLRKTVRFNDLDEPSEEASASSVSAVSSELLNVEDRVPPTQPTTMTEGAPVVTKMEPEQVGETVCQRILDCARSCFCCGQKEHVE